MDTNTKQCATCGGTGEIILSEFPTAEGEHTPAVCIECGGSGNVEQRPTPTAKLIEQA